MLLQDSIRITAVLAGFILNVSMNHMLVELRCRFCPAVSMINANVTTSTIISTNAASTI